MNRFCLLARSTFTYYQTKNFSLNQPFLKTRKNSDLKISQACVDRLTEIAKDGQFLRVTVDGGGCSGFQYKFDLDSNFEEEDECFEKDGVKIVVDKMTLPFLKGSTVDYHEELIKSAFRIIDNPQADTRCSCGASFAIKMP